MNIFTLESIAFTVLL